MKTRTGKIAQLPKEIRDELNQRLQNGKQGPELLKWLNALPETQALLAEKFDDVPISKQNLSEWRKGGYEEWLRCQQRELRIQRLIEEGTCLGEHDAKSDDDLFEHSARIALAELMADFDTLHELKGEARSKRLLTLTRELSRLQYAYNHSRWTALGYSKWNDRFLGPEDYEEDETEITTTSENPEPSHAPQNSAPRIEQSVVKPSNTTSTEGEVDDRVYLHRAIYHHKNCGHICCDCHSEDGEYPYAEALKDSTEAKQLGVQAFWRGRTMIVTHPTECKCPCDQC